MTVLLLRLGDMRPEQDCYGNTLENAHNLTALALTGVWFNCGH